ncbi:MAG: dienelactone hydrolase family protein [Longimicrobiales bacterium]
MMTRYRRSLLGSLALLPFVAACASAGSMGAASDVDAGYLDGFGPFEVRRYADFPDAPEFAGATIYYPADAPSVGGVAIAPGFTEEQRHIAWWGPRLASHGYAVLLIDTNDRRERPDARADALIAGVRLLRAEGGRPGSPLFGRVDSDRMAIMGHSMGGGGALLAANEHSDQIRAAIPFTPWEPATSLAGIRAPTLILAGSADRVAEVDEHSWRHFGLIPESTPKVYLEVAGGDHYIADTTRGTDLATMGRYALAWLKLYVDRDDRYRDVIYGALPPADAAKFSRYVANP